MPNPITTIEQAQERILELESQLETVTTERDTLLHDKSELSTHLENARTLNQKLFERVEAQHADGSAPDDDDEPAPSCEDFAKSLNI